MLKANHEQMKKKVPGKKENTGSYCSRSPIIE
jgi:hypothetical protein